MLDPAFLNELLEGETTLFGTPYEFQEPLTAGPSDFCAWKEGSTSLSLQVTLEPAATSEIDDHSGRAYNIDVDPVPVPQDGPGTSAVLLTDPAFEGSGEGDFAYGYFFVAGRRHGVRESVGLDLGASKPAGDGRRGGLAARRGVSVQRPRHGGELRRRDAPTRRQRSERTLRAAAPGRRPPAR